MVFPQNITNGHVNLKLISREFQTHSLSKLMSNPENSHRKCKLPGCLNSLAVNNAPYGGCRRDFSVSPGMETSIGGVMPVTKRRALSANSQRRGIHSSDMGNPRAFSSFSIGGWGPFERITNSIYPGLQEIPIKGYISRLFQPTIHRSLLGIFIIP